ncbi:MAG TPA: hypothetical protein VIY86_11675, partial [Pirellulaceae bacterium]
IPVVRDLDAAGREVLGIEHAPTIVILDPQSRVQLFEVGGNSELDRALELVLARLYRGEDLASAYQRAARDRQDRYQSGLTAARAGRMPFGPDDPLGGPK